MKSTVRTFITPKGTGLLKRWDRAYGRFGAIDKKVTKEKPLRKGALAEILKREMIQLNEIEIGKWDIAVKGSIVLVGDDLGRVTNISGNKANILVTHYRKANPMNRANAVYARLEKPQLFERVNLGGVAAISFKIKATDLEGRAKKKGK